MVSSSASEIAATLCFGSAITHTFLVKWFQRQALKFRGGSVGENFFHLLGEVEVVFGFWAGIYLFYLFISQGNLAAIDYLESQNFTEPAFVFVIMTVCSSKPVLQVARRLIGAISKLLPLNRTLAFFVTTLIVGPLLGSLITEPAAMTVTALILLDRYFTQGISNQLKYATLGLLFVNVSIGGTLTPFAAPPVLMVASKWNWDLMFMLTNFGWKGFLAVTISTSLVAFRFRKEISELSKNHSDTVTQKVLPVWINVVHLLFLMLIVMTSHYVAVFVGIFMFFLGLVTVTREYQDELKLKEGLLVAFFLGGLVVLGTPQRWWLEPLITRFEVLPLYLGTMGLTAFTDNAALTYLGSQVPTLTDASKYALVAGSVVGGGLTVIANAPNPAGYGILNPTFGEEGISPFLLAAYALPPTLIAAGCYWFL